MIIIRSFDSALSGIRAANPEVKLSVARDVALGDEPVLVVAYPVKSGPASRDVWSEAEHSDWSRGRAISFQIKPAQALKLSLSFLDRNGVAYTCWAQLEAGLWQPVRLAFDGMRPNPYFQPPGARTGAPLDVSQVTAIGFAPQDPGPGSLAISAFRVTD